MSNVLYANSTGELRIRLLDDTGQEVTNATVTADFAHGSTPIFSGRSMVYSSTRRAQPQLAPGCYYCQVLATEVTSTQGIYTATITSEDTNGNTLVTEIQIFVETYNGS